MYKPWPATRYKLKIILWFFFLLIHCLWYSARWYGFSLFSFCDNLYGGYRNIHSESKLWYKKCKWLFLAIQNYVILSLVQLTNKNIYMCTCRTVEYRYHHNVNHHLHWFFNTYLYRYMYVFRWIFHNQKSESNFPWR